MKASSIVWVIVFCACGDDATPDTQNAADSDAAPGDVADTENAADSDGSPDTSPDLEVGPDVETFACAARAPVVPTTKFFADISKASGIQVDNFVVKPRVKIPINDHSRLAFVDVTGDGYDDIVAGSLFPNPQAGVPFEHLVFANDHDGTFTDISDASGLRDVQAGLFAFGDVDNDGDLDCFAGLDAEIPEGGQHGVFLNDGAGHFSEKAASGISLDNVVPAVGNAVFADFDNDAKLDLYLGIGQTSYAGKDMLFMGNGDGTFRNASSDLVGNKSLQTNGTVTCDFDNDGDVDIVVSTYGVSTGKGHNLLWLNDGHGHFDDVGEATGYAALATGNYWLASTGHGSDPEPGANAATYIGDNGFGVDCDDIDNDGLMDIFQTAISHPVNEDYSRKWSDPSQLLMNLGPDHAFAFENRYLAAGLPFNEGDVDGGVVDFDNDGHLDLSLSRDSKYEASYSDDDQKGWLGLMRQKGDGTFESVGLVSGINNLQARYTASLTACENDTPCESGERCLFAACRKPCKVDDDCPVSDAGEACGWFWNDATSASQAFCRPLVEGKRAQNHAWSDIDHDGDLDLLVGGRDAGGGRPNFLFRNDIGSQNRWLAIRVKGDGVHVNRDGIGTRLVVTTGDHHQMREVQGSRGTYNSMDGMTQHFGLGDFPCGYALEVRWPDGTTARFEPGTFPEGYLELTYPRTLTW